MFEFNYLKALYRRNNSGKPCVWYAKSYAENKYIIYYGIVGKTITTQFASTHRNVNAQIESDIKDKRKKGYKYLNEIKDNLSSPVEGELYDFLNAYLPNIRTTIDGDKLAMLAKAYDNTNNRLFKNCNTYYGQYKINGLRCSIRAIVNNNDLFKPIRLEFQSREGIKWKSLYALEEYLLNSIPNCFLQKMIDEDIMLDGEVYLPGYSVNQIDHFVKDPRCKENSLLQFWCYDLIMENTIQITRMSNLYSYLNRFVGNFDSKYEHLNNTNKLIILPNSIIVDDNTARTTRDKYIDLGFEGLIIRNPNAEYQFGKRNLSMIKYKRHTDGKFRIIDIYPEGAKRPDIPLFLCKNDINDANFECHVGGSMDYQRSVLNAKEKYIGKYMFVEYGERSGVEQVPFHIKGTHIIS